MKTKRRRPTTGGCNEKAPPHAVEGSGMKTRKAGLLNRPPEAKESMKAPVVPL